MKIRSAFKNPYILFSPFLVLFIIWVFINPPTGTSGDEERYLFYAGNLIHGFYSPPAPDIQLTNGPGYPILLIPFLLLKMPLISITFLNAFFYYFSIVLLFKALKEIVSNVVAHTFSFLWAFYFIAYQSISLIHTETFTYLLISILIFSAIKTFRHNNPGVVKKYMILSGFILGYIVLTKMIFGYVLIFMLAGSGLLWLFNRKNLNYRKSVVIILLALATTFPYLVYTYQITGRLFYWGNGNDSLYWMSNSNNNNEFGSWFPDQTMHTEPNFFDYYMPGCRDSIMLHHGNELAVIHKLKGLKLDDAYTNIAVKNIKEHPQTYIKNIIYNAGRLLFQYPFSYGIHRPKVLLVFPLNGILLTLMLFSLIPTLLNWRRIDYPVRFLLFIALFYLGGSLLVTTYVRMFTVIVPILLIWIAFVFEHTVKINLKFYKEP
jgi:4-amino-4-deoxy-L-arabinose transferase-like glycosyltransferase